ncbi:hypothetical protein AB3S75_012896 [Citrus x aurantiifolia]
MFIFEFVEFVKCIIISIRREMSCDPFEEAFDAVTEMEPLGDSMITSIETSEEWNTWRTNLAQEMYHQRRASRQST